MRQTNIFRTTKRDHVIPRDTMIRALKLSPGQDWCDPKTAAYEYLKNWALNEDVKKDGPIREKVEKQTWNGHVLDEFVIEEAQKMSPGKDINDKRTKAYKYLQGYIDGQTN